MIELDLIFQNLKRIQALLTAAAIEVGYTLPARRYVTVGGAVYDCEQAVVSLMSSDPGIVSADPGAINLLGNCDAPWNASYEVAIVVCAAEAVQGPNGEDPPLVADVEADALTMSNGYAVLRTMVENIVASGEFGTPSGNIQFGQPQGGLVATVLTLNANAWYYVSA